MLITKEAKTYFWSFSWRKTNTSDRSMAWTSATKKQRLRFCCLCGTQQWQHVFKDTWALETSWTFKSSCRVFQLKHSIMQQLSPSDQVLLCKHLTTLHPHDGLTVSATGDHRKQTLSSHLISYQHWATKKNICKKLWLRIMFQLLFYYGNSSS